MSRAEQSRAASCAEIPVIAVIMSTYNGEKYLAEQIDTILAQEGVNIELYIRDDGSTDSTRNILTEYAHTHNNIHLDFGSNIGVCRSFIQELISAPEYEYYAFSDQDDYWYPEKLFQAVCLVKQKELETGGIIPVLYYSNVYATDEKLRIVRKKSKHKRLQNLACATLFRCIGGCTMLMNSKAKHLMKPSNLSNDNLMLHNHDSIIASVVYALGGIVICDPGAYMLYRIHGHNTSGATIGMISRMKSRLRGLKKYKGCEPKIARAILDVYGDSVVDDARDTLETIAGYKDKLSLRLKIVFSPKFRTGDLRLTLYCKFKALFGLL